MARTNSRAAKDSNKKARTVKMCEIPSTSSSSSSSSLPLTTRSTQLINQMTPSSTIILIFASAIAVGNARRKALITTTSPSFEDIFTSQKEETLFKEIFSNLNQTDITNAINSAKAISNESNRNDDINMTGINSPFDDNDVDVNDNDVNVNDDDSQDTYNQTFNNEI